MSSRPTFDDARNPVRRDVSVRSSPRASTAWLAFRLRLRRSPLVIAAAVMVISLPLCLVFGLVLDVPVARAALQAPADLRDVAQVFSDLGLSGYMLLLSGLVTAGAFVALRRGRSSGRGPS